MARYLSEEWFDLVAASLAPRKNGAAGQPHLVIQQVVTGTPEGDVVYAVAVDGDAVSLTRGRHDNADVTIAEDYETAVSIHNGVLSLHEAFLAGRIKVTGNVGSLVANQAALAAIDPLPESLRQETTF